MSSLEHNTEKRLAYEEGVAEGEKQKQMEIAKNIINDNIPIEVVSKNTGLSIEELKSLQKEH